MSSENNKITIKQAKKNLEYAVNLHNCIETPLDEKIIAFAEHDKTAKAYRDLAIRKLAGEDVDGYLFTLRNSALDRFYHWNSWIREYEEGRAEGLAEGKRETVLNAIAMGLSTQQIMQLTGLSKEELRKLR